MADCVEDCDARAEERGVGHRVDGCGDRDHGLGAEEDVFLVWKMGGK